MVSGINIFEILKSAGAEPYFNGNAISCRAIYRNGLSPSSVTIYEKDNKVIDWPASKHFTIPEFIKLINGQDIVLEDFVPKQELDVLETKKYYDISLLDELDKDYSYWNGRGISSELLEKFKCGVDKNGKMWNRFIFPIFDMQGRIEAVSGRSLVDTKNFTPEQLKKYKKWKHVAGRKGQLGDCCYPLFLNHKIIEQKKEVVIVESIGNLLSLMMNGIYNVWALLSLNLGNGVLSNLLRYDVQRIILALDNDTDKKKNWGQNGLKKIHKKLLNYFDSEQIIIAPPLPGKDFNEMTFQERLIWKEKYNL